MSKRKEDAPQAAPDQKKAKVPDPFEHVKISGTKIAAEIRAEVKEQVDTLVNKHNVIPHLAVVLVGSRPDSAAYVKLKEKAALECGVKTTQKNFSEDVKQEELEKLVDELCADSSVHGILVQLPMPKHINEDAVLRRIAVEKDVDGFTEGNIGRLCMRGGLPPLAVPCTPAGVVELLQRSNIVVKGKECVVLGRSNIVGMPVAALLQSMNGTVTVVHSATSPESMRDHLARADIVVAAIGKPRFVRGEWLKSGCVVIDVGINMIEDATRKSGQRMVGDVHYDEAKTVASRITPVPGGVGPMTVALLMRNCVALARNAAGLPRLPLRKVREAIPNV